MAGVLTYLQQRAKDEWLIGHDSQQFFQLSEHLFLNLTQYKTRKTPLKIILAQEDPLHFLASFLAACAAECHVFLCNSYWVEQEWQYVLDLVQPDIVWGLPAVSRQLFGNSLQVNEQQTTNNLKIMIPTGGSSGKIRFAIHTWETLMASVQGFHHYFGGKAINSFCVLPLHHVSGLMQFLRSFTTGGRMVILPFKTLVAGEEYHLDPREFFLSLVPTQLSRLITSGASTWLSRFQTVLLGGAPAWVELLEQARYYNIFLAPTYGMTETASQVVTLKPEEFLSGNNSCGQVLPHAKVTIQSLTGEILGVNQTGIITIESDSLALGYYPQGEIQNLSSDDLGFFDEKGYLNIVGRRTHKIITGGENVFPTEVEAAIRATQLVTDVCVIGLPDNYWGQAVTAVYVPSSLLTSPTLLKAAVENKLCKFKRPKYWLTVESLPRNAQGKVNYEQLQQLTSKALKELLLV